MFDPIFAGEGEMQRLARTVDWSGTPLGSPASWPAPLRMALRIALDSRWPMAVWWGPGLASLHNAALGSLLGRHHPEAFARPAAGAWGGSWAVLGPAAGAILAGGPAMVHERLPVELARNGFAEECHFTVSMSPVGDDAGAARGVFCAFHEETATVLATRRLRTLREVEATWGEADPYRQCQRAAEALARNGADAPFALVYLLEDDGVHARRAGVAGIPPEHPAAAPVVRLHGAPPEDPWCFGAAGRSGTGCDVPLRVAGPLPGGAWPEPARAARVVPLHRPGCARPAGFVVAGLSPRLPVTEEYRAFVDLAASHIATAVASVRARDEDAARHAELAKLDRAKTVFFTNVGHEFRTPLTLVRGPIEEILAGDAGEVTPPLRSRMEMLRRNALRLQKLVNALLEFARAEAGRTRVAFEPVDLGAFTRELASTFAAAMQRAGLAFEVACAPLSVPVYVDRELWEKIVLNLLSNAIKYTLRGSVRVALTEDADGVTLAVADTGAGIPAEDVPRIFERFHRVHGSAGRSEEGSGIGLALVREFARLHGGRVAVDSRVGKGSTFRVTLPKGQGHLPPERLLRVARRAPTPTVAASAYVEEAFRWLPDARDLESRPASYVLDATMPPMPRRRAGRERILVADDNADMRQYLQRLLARDYDVDTAPDGEIALASALATTPDLVLSGAAMPKLDGYGLIAKLKGVPRTAGVPVILLTARPGEEANVEALAAGASDTLAKPFGARELLARVAARLEIQRLARESEERVSRAEQRLRLATEAAGIYSWEVDIDARVILHSGNAERQLGFALPRQFDDMLALVHPSDRPAMREAFERAMHEGRRFEAEFRFVHPRTGEDVWQLSHGLLLEPGPRSGRRLVGITQDITMRKRAEMVLRRDELNAQFVNQLDVLLAPLSEPQDILALCTRRLGEFMGADRCYVSEPKGETLAIQPGDWAGQDLGSIAGVHPLANMIPEVNFAKLAAGDTLAVADVVADPAYDTLAERLVQRGIRAFVSVPYHSDGEWQGTLVVAQRLPTEWRGDQLQLVRDVTTRLWPSVQRARYERSLRESEARFRAMADSSPVMIWVTDAEGRLTFANLTYLDFFGVTRERIAGLDWRGLVHPDDREAFTQAFEAAVRERAHFHFRARVQRRDGRWRWIESRGNPRLDEAGAVREFIGSSPDVTEFYESQELMRQAERRKDEFLAMLAHELRNPLAPIVNATRALRRLDGTQPEAIGMREMIERQTEQLTRLVDDLLDVSRITRGIIVLRKENVELISIVARALEMSRPLIDGRHHHLQLALPAEPVRVDGDAARLAQVISNLLNNAAKYTEEGGELELAVAVEGTQVVLCVRDDGMGIPAEELPHVFDLFSQGERTLDRAQGGLGIGLTVVKQLVHMHRGTVEAHSEGPGKGSRFVVRLPLAHAPHDRGAAPMPPPPAARRRLKVMVVDDNVDSATSMALLLKLDGYDVKLAHDGPEALEAARAFRPALMLLDIGLPSLSGYEVAHALRQDPATREVTLVAMTGYGQAEDRARTLAAGFDHHLTKPVDEAQLASLLESLAAGADAS